jgi:hypothetical protein
VGSPLYQVIRFQTIAADNRTENGHNGNAAVFNQSLADGGRDFRAQQRPGEVQHTTIENRRARAQHSG